MIGEMIVVVLFLAVLMSGWFLLQSLTRKTCRGGKDTDIFQGLAEGCGGCGGDGSCKRRKH